MFDVWNNFSDRDFIKNTLRTFDFPSTAVQKTFRLSPLGGSAYHTPLKLLI